MTKKMASVLVAYGVVLAVTLVLLKRSGAEVGTFLVPAGLVGTGFCAAWGAISVASPRGRTWPVLVLIALAFMFLAQTVNAWSKSLPNLDGNLLTPLLLSLAFLMTMGVLAYVLYADRPDSFWAGRTLTNSTPPDPRLRK